MSFLEHQHIEFENVLSYRTRTDAVKLGALLEFIKKNTDALELEITGNIVFTILEMYKFTNKCILGLEVLIPVNRVFESSEHYVYKPRFRLVNAVSARCGNGFNDLVVLNDSILRYLDDNHLKPISDIYYIADIDQNRSFAQAYTAIVSIDDNMV